MSPSRSGAEASAPAASGAVMAADATSGQAVSCTRTAASQSAFLSPLGATDTMRHSCSRAREKALAMA